MNNFARVSKIEIKFTLVFVISYFANGYSSGQNLLMMKNNILKGTTIITSIQSDKIIIAADSKQTWGGDLPPDNSIIPLKCKIRHIDNFFFAAEGHTTMISPRIDYLEIIESLDLSDKKRFVEKIDYIESKLKGSVDQFVVNFQKHSPNAFNQILNKTLFSILFSTFEDDLPVGIAIYWNIKSNDDGWEVIAQRASSDLIPRDMIQGQKTGIDRLFQRNPSYASNLYNVPGVLELINIQITDTPDKVGGPVDVVVITAQGHKWIQKKEQCK
jgi:hypothetical protein